jgi:hypothetical protein
VELKISGYPSAEFGSDTRPATARLQVINSTCANPKDLWTGPMKSVSACGVSSFSQRCSISDFVFDLLWLFYCTPPWQVDWPTDAQMAQLMDASKVCEEDVPVTWASGVGTIEVLLEAYAAVSVSL